jgi:hypothetical protein
MGQGGIERSQVHIRVETTAYALHVCLEVLVPNIEAAHLRLVPGNYPQESTVDPDGVGDERLVFGQEVLSICQRQRPERRQLGLVGELAD